MRVALEAAETATRDAEAAKEAVRVALEESERAKEAEIDAAVQEAIISYRLTEEMIEDYEGEDAAEEVLAVDGSAAAEEAPVNAAADADAAADLS
ncbi:unnamed protein product [Prunus brigantina]